MKFISISILSYCFMLITIVECQVTFLENFRKEYRFLRFFFDKLIGHTDNEWAYKWNLDRNRVQKPIPLNENFPCDTKNGPGARSKKIPTSVHKLRPGDIDIIGALGDSLTAGNGALATNILQVLIENRGISWTIGGQGTWHNFLTIPNILKVFNPNLYGYALGDSLSIKRESKFNVAEIGAMSRDLPREAKELIHRMSSDPNVNIKKHWKLVSVMIGSNDYCTDICYRKYPEKTIDYHERDLIAMLRILRDNLPRTMVNLVTNPSLQVLTEFKGKPLECQTTHTVECPCIIGTKYSHDRQLYFNIMNSWKDVVANVSRLEEFNNKQDFTVTNQPFLRNVEFPKTSSGNTDFTYMSHDCFHLSQKGYAIASNALWNNMLEPEGSKATNWRKEFLEIKCPTIERPYIATKQNS